MLILLFIIFTLLFVAGFFNDWDIGPVICFICMLICIFCGVGCAYSISEGFVLEEKIAMYEEENTNIENDMATLVEQYMNYESNTYGDLKGESSISLVSLYPELKADTLVTKQIEIYVSNNEKIKELKEALIDVKVAKWWLYFNIGE